MSIKLHGLTKHGLTANGVKHPIYKLRERMMYYCYSVPETNETVYRCYRGKGITVCDEWRNDIMSFYNWCMNNGWQKGRQIDRIDSSGNYEPSNCQFLSPSEHSIKTIAENDRRGMKSGTAVLDNDKVAAIKLLLRCGYTITKIAEFFGVGNTTISYINMGKTWKDIGE